MFGYVKAAPSFLPEKEARRYEGVYCGLCRALGRKYGWTARFILNYDFVFLALLLAGEEQGCFSSCSCPVTPWKKKTCWSLGPALEMAADESVILTFWKLQDGLRDGGFWERMVCRLACASLKRHYRRAKAERPAFDETVKTCLSELQTLEQRRVRSLDRPADTFARLLMGAANESPLPARTRAREQILYHVGRWIYLVDAWDDWRKDQKTGNYNPLLARYGSEVEVHREEVRETLHISLGLADTAFSLLDWGEWEELLRHILETGLPAVEEAVFTGQWREKRRKMKKA